MKTIQIVVKEPLKAPEVRQVANVLEAKQQIVGGWIEYLPFEDFDMYLNEEGKLMRLPSNLKTDFDVIVGTVYLTKADEEGKDIGLTDEEVEKAILLLNRYSIQSPAEAAYYDEIIKSRFS